MERLVVDIVRLCSLPGRLRGRMMRTHGGGNNRWSGGDAVVSKVPLLFQLTVMLLGKGFARAVMSAVVIKSGRKLSRASDGSRQRQQSEMKKNIQ